MPPFRVTAHYVCHDEKASGALDFTLDAPAPPSAADVQAAAFRQAEAELARRGAGGGRIDVDGVRCSALTSDGGGTTTPDPRALADWLTQLADPFRLRLVARLLRGRRRWRSWPRWSAWSAPA